MKNNLTFRKSRSRWLAERDANTKFFRACVTSKSKRNQIKAIFFQEIWKEGVLEVRQAMVDYFVNIVTEEEWCRPNLDGIQFNALSEEEKSSFEALFSACEIEETIATCDGNKCPDPDGFNYKFIKEFWNF